MTEEDKAQTQDGDATGKEKAGKEKGQEEGEVKTFSQEEVNTAIRDRLKRQEKKYADYSDLKKAAGEWDKHKESQKTDLERLEAQVKNLEAERDEANKQTQQTILKSAFATEASKLGVQFPEDAHLLVNLSDFSVEDGKVDGVEDAVKTLVDSGRLPIKSAKKSPEINAQTGGKSGDGQELSDAEKQELAAIYGVDPQYIK